MPEIRQTRIFTQWLAGLQDGVGRGRVAARIQRFRFGHFGDAKPVGLGVWEMRVNTGPGYRIYYRQIGNEIVLSLCGGDKTSQKRDILRAKSMILESSNDATDDEF